MTIIPHDSNGVKIAEVISDQILIKTVDDGLQLLADLYYQDFVAIIIHQKNITPDFFVLKNGMAGELLQKFSNFRMRLGIAGDFSTVNSNSLHAFIGESNAKNMIVFGLFNDVFSTLSVT
jgi:hypothetical protein